MSEKVNAVYTVAEIQQILRISRSAVYSAIHAGIIPSIRIGRSVRVPVCAFELWLQAGKFEI